MDKDYRSDGEREAIISACEAYCRYAIIHKCKEIENFLLIPAAIDRAAERRVSDQARRTGATRVYSGNAAAFLSAFAEQERPSIMGQYIADRRRFERTTSSHLADATIGEAAVREFERCWGTDQSRLEVIPGKDALRALNQNLQDQYGVNVTAAGIVDAMRRDEVPAEMVELIQNIANFSALRVD